ncbi:MAG TPA: D-hexose-6-phosphate mutarotase [Gemmatimonadaceae bacterium]|jgi:glucose-6-phosphate 1-epimerase
MEKVEIVARDGACVELYTHGAQVTSWKPASGEERLFLSRRSSFSPDAAIRGGVPIIFPQFASMGPLPKHGFARIQEWEVVRAGRTSKGKGEGNLRLTATPQTRALWDHGFDASFVVSVEGMTLSVALSVFNEDTKPLDFTAALHTYLLVDDVRSTTVLGLQGMEYRDSAAGGGRKCQDAEGVVPSGELDRIYYDVRSPIEVRDAMRRTRLSMTGFSDAVVWNPGAERAAALQDMEPSGWLRMLCVEAAVIGTPVHLEPNERWTGQQVLTAM